MEKESKTSENVLKPAQDFRGFLYSHISATLSFLSTLQGVRQYTKVNLLWLSHTVKLSSCTVTYNYIPEQSSIKHNGLT